MTDKIKFATAVLLLVAGLAGYLVSQESEYVTGQAISINGGMA